MSPHYVENLCKKVSISILCYKKPCLKYLLYIKQKTRFGLILSNCSDCDMLTYRCYTHLYQKIPTDRTTKQVYLIHNTQIWQAWRFKLPKADCLIRILYDQFNLIRVLFQTRRGSPVDNRPLSTSFNTLSKNTNLKTCDTWHVTYTMWHMTVGGRWTFSQNLSSLALTVWE